MKSKICALSDEIINQIAAGEVIESPVSAVKEMVENAIDASATVIKIKIEDGGKSLISVEDDGFGMNAEDLKVCYLRHTTSKLRTPEDLFRLKTNGFRGEAIASIAAISKMTVTTREANAIEGLQLQIVGNVPSEIFKVSAKKGTTFKVENLFFNTPVRKNFLKSTASECTKITDIVSRLALAHPEIRFEYQLHGKDILLATAKNLEDRIAEVIGSGFAKKMIPVDYTENKIHVFGFIPPIEDAVKKKPSSYFFLQNRPIWNAMLNKALANAYNAYGKAHPVCILFLELENNAYDVNVHPSKREIRFSDDQAVFLAVLHAVKETLREHENGKTESPFLSLKNTTNQESDCLPYHAVQEKIPSYSYQEASSKDLFENTEKAPNVLSFQKGQDSENLFSDEKCSSLLPPFLQIAKTYILCEDLNGILIIDQHAAHARILYEQALRILDANAQIEMQELLFPELIELSKQEAYILHSYSRTIERLGFYLEPFGGESFQLRAIPSTLPLSKAVKTIHEFLEFLEEEKEINKMHTIFAKAYAKTNAYRAGDILSQKEMAKLMSDLLQTDVPEDSPFGKKTMMRISAEDLGKKFKR